MYICNIAPNEIGRIPQMIPLYAATKRSSVPLLTQTVELFIGKLNGEFQ